MPVLGFNHINLHLPRSQLESVRDFYVDLLGFVDGDRPPFRRAGYWLYCGGLAVIHLIESPEKESAVQHRGEVIDHVAYECSDYDEMRRRLDAAGVDYRAREVPETSVRQLFLSDPAGVGVELQFAGS